jgi:hypothetical protein
MAELLDEVGEGNIRHQVGRGITSDTLGIKRFGF